MVHGREMSERPDGIGEVSRQNTPHFESGGPVYWSHAPQLSWPNSFPTEQNVLAYVSLALIWDGVNDADRPGGILYATGRAHVQPGGRQEARTHHRPPPRRRAEITERDEPLPFVCLHRLRTSRRDIADRTRPRRLV